MTITIHNTTEISEVNGVPCRLWEGTTDSGIKVQCLITRIAALSSGQDLGQFEAELLEQEPPSEGPRAFPLRMVI